MCPRLSIVDPTAVTIYYSSASSTTGLTNNIFASQFKAKTVVTRNMSLPSSDTTIKRRGYSFLADSKMKRASRSCF